MHNKHRGKYLYAFRWFKHLKQHHRPPAKKENIITSPFSVFPSTAGYAPEPLELPDDYVVPMPHHLWGLPGVPQPTRIKLLRPQKAGLVGRVTLPKARPVVVRPWARPTVQIPGETMEWPIVDNCLRRLESFFRPMHSALHRMLSQNDALYKINMQMAWTLGHHGLGLPTEETPTDVPQEDVDEAMQPVDPFDADWYTDPTASGSGGTGQTPVVVIRNYPKKSLVDLELERR